MVSYAIDLCIQIGEIYYYIIQLCVLDFLPFFNCTNEFDCN